MVESDGLENRCSGNATVGSNPTLSAEVTGLRQVQVYRLSSLVKFSNFNYNST